MSSSQFEVLKKIKSIIFHIHIDQGIYERIFKIIKIIIFESDSWLVLISGEIQQVCSAENAGRRTLLDSTGHLEVCNESFYQNI